MRYVVAPCDNLIRVIRVGSLRVITSYIYIYIYIYTELLWFSLEIDNYVFLIYLLLKYS